MTKDFSPQGFNILNPYKTNPQKIPVIPAKAGI